MDTGTTSQLNRVWNQKDIPVIHRQGRGHRLRIRLPFAVDNRAKLRRARKSIPDWIASKRHWEVPQSWFNELVAEQLTDHGRVYIIQPLNRQEKCAPACWNAKGHECQCSCLGAHHGQSHPGGRWLEVSETFAVKTERGELACRLLTRSDPR